MKRHQSIILILLFCLFIVPATNAHAQTNPPVVRAVLFYSPLCGHCQYVINNTLTPMMDRYGGQLEIIAFDTTQEYGQKFFLATLQKFNLEQGGVPFLVIDDMYLVGSLDIPEKFPGLVETHLAQGGVDWPDIPGLREVISQSLEADTSTATASAQSAASQTPPESVAAAPTPISPIVTPGLIPPETHDLNWADKFAQDPVGNTLAVLVLAGMIASVGWTVILFQNTNGISLKGDWAWIIPVLCAVGFCVAGYLAYVETAQVTAVCGPVGDCNTVQQSEYARLFGILPIGVLGLIGYIAIFISWMIARYTYNRMSDFAAISLFVMTALGTLFSIYLTFLEPFVIGATCAWCLTSAILMTILMLLSVKPVKLAICMNSFFTSHRRKRSRIGVFHD